MVEVVIKRKKVDTQAMYGAFKTKLALPTCAKCHAPFNYSWRNGRRDEGVQHGHVDGHGQPLGLNRKGLRPSTSASTSGAGDTGNDCPSMTSHPRMLLKVVRSIRTFVVHRREAPEDGDVVDDNADPELWYGNEFRRQLKTYFNPELERPSLSLRGGRYPIGARVACFAGKDTWYPGAVATSRENNTYDVRYDNGDVAQHVFPHMIRFEPTHSDSGLLCFYYGLALAAAAAWPLMGVWYFSTSTTASGIGAATAVPALLVGVAGTVAVAVQFWVIYCENKSTGLRMMLKYAVVAALPSASLALVGITAMAKALHPSSTGSWVKVRKEDMRFVLSRFRWESGWWRRNVKVLLSKPRAQSRLAEPYKHPKTQPGFLLRTGSWIIEQPICDGNIVQSLPSRCCRRQAFRGSVAGAANASASALTPTRSQSHLFAPLCFSTTLQQMLLLPSMLFSITGGGYAYAVSPAYGIAWAAASPPWLLFVLLVSLRLDGAAGDASPVFGRMQWLAVFFPVWLVTLMVIAAFCVLPYVWDIEVFPEASNTPGAWQVWLSGLAGRVRRAIGQTVRARGRTGGDAVGVDDGGEQGSQNENGRDGDSSLY